MNLSRAVSTLCLAGATGLACVLFLAVVAAAAVPVKPGTVVGNVKAGKKDFKLHGCDSCHNLAAAGAFESSGAGPDLDHIRLTYTQILNNITKGGKGMTPYKSVLTVAQIQDLSAFIYKANHPA